MNYNPENIKGVRPRKGQVWVHRETSYPVRIMARRTGSTLMTLRRRSKLSECEDLHSMIAWCTPDGQKGGLDYESEFVKEFQYYRTP